MRSEDLTGRKFGRLRALKQVGRTSGGNGLWLCVCDCDEHNKKIIRADLLKSGKTTSCGCLIRELNTSRLTKYFDEDSKRIARIFYGMRNRCYNKHDPNYQNYGARGITICDEWLSDYTKFVDWSKSHGYSKGLSIDRIDNSRGYCPDNCRWATQIVQNNNMRSNRTFTLMRMTKTIADWARYFNVDPHHLWYKPDCIVLSRLQDLMRTKLKKMFADGCGDVALRQMGLTESQVKECLW